MLTMSFDGLDRGVGRDLHVRRTKERGASLAAGNRRNARHHLVLDEGTDNDNGDFRVFPRLDLIDKRLLCCAIRQIEWHIRVCEVGVVDTRRVKGLLERNVLVLISLLVVDDNVHALGPRVRVAVADAKRRVRHAVELANLRRALEHLERLAVVRHLERLRVDNGHTTEAAGLEAIRALLETSDGLLAALGELDHLLRSGRHVKRQLRRDDQKVGLHLVAAHAVLDILNRLVEATAILLHDGIHHDLMSHGLAHRTARAKPALQVITEIVVGAGQVRKERVKVARLLDTVADAGKLVLEVLAARLGRVEIALDGKTNAAAHNAVAVTPAQARRHARDTFIRHALKKAHVEV